jgi:hypothetical protein
MSKSRPKPPDCGDSPKSPGGSGAKPTGSGSGAAPAPSGSGKGSGSTASCSAATKDVNNRVTETITNGNPAAWNGTYSWDSKYHVAVDKSKCTVTATVKLKVSGTITAAQKTAWKNAIESKWNNKVRFCCTGCNCPKGLSVSVAVQYVDSGEDYTVAAQTPAATEGGRSGLGGTTSMTGWGVNDTVDITHEFGHMLGNPEEYFTTNGVDYSEGGKKKPFRDPSGGIMNNPANNPLPRNYDPIKSAAESAMGGASCACRAIGA